MSDPRLNDVRRILMAARTARSGSMLAEAISILTDIVADLDKGRPEKGPNDGSG